MLQIFNYKLHNQQNGFSVIELLIAIAIAAILLSVATVSGRFFQDTVNLSNAEKMIGTNIKLAKANSISSLNDFNYGIHFESDSVIIFRGSTFIIGDLANQTVNLPSGVEIYSVNLNGGGSDLLFSRLIGTTDNFGAVGIRLIQNPSQTRQIVVNQEGQVNHSSFQTSLVAPITNARHAHYDLGWNIKNSLILRLEWVDNFNAPIITNDIDATAYFNTDQSIFDWSGTTMVNGLSQSLRIHGWLDASDDTILCVIRDQTESDTLNIYFVDATIAKKITTYVYAGGIVTITPDAFYGGALTIK